MPHKDIEKKRETQRKADKKWYANPENKKKRIAYILRKKKQLRAWWRRLKSGLRCRCGENHPACLDFHHRNPKEKEISISDFIIKGIGIARFIEELEKCDVLCSNCHRKLHWRLKSRHKMEKPESLISERPDTNLAGTVLLSP